MNILFMAPDYPNKYRASFEFVKNLVEALADRGNHCYVIAPYSISHEKRFWHGLEEQQRANGGSVTVCRPNHLTFSNWKIGRVSLTEISRRIAINYALKRLKFKADVAYGHFWSSGFELYEFAKKKGIPLYVATGESEISGTFRNSNKIKLFCDYLRGVICVSTKNKNESVSLGLATEEKCFISPNCIDSRLFKVMNKSESRRKLNISMDAFVVVFLGWFKHVKGPERVAAAIETITDGAPVYSMFLGSGSEEDPQCKNMLIKKRLKHDEVPEFLNAADVFVLPTRHEGCCNSIVEAMACGLPVISSNLPFNWDILNDSNSIMIDPDNIEEIAKAIVTLRDNIAMRQQLAEGALATARGLTIDKRAESIENYIKSTM